MPRGAREWKCTAHHDGETCGLVTRREVKTCTNGHTKKGREQWIHRLENEPGNLLAEIVGLVGQRFGDITEDDLRMLLKVHACIQVYILSEFTLKIFTF